MIALEGPLTYDRVVAARAVLDGSTDEGAVVRLDLGKVTEADSAGVAFLALFARSAAAAGKSVEIVNASPELRRTLDLFPFPKPDAQKAPATGKRLENLGTATVEVAELIQRALTETPGGLSFEPFRRGALAGARTMARAPLELANRASGGRLRKLLSRGSDIAEPEAVEEVDALVERELTRSDGVLARAATAVELQLSAEVNPFLDHAIDRFDVLWRARSPRS